MQNIVKMMIGLTVLGGLLGNNGAAMVTTMYPFNDDPRYINALKGMGVNSFQLYMSDEYLYRMSITNTYNCDAYSNIVIKCYKNHMQVQAGALPTPHIRGWTLSGGPATTNYNPGVRIDDPDPYYPYAPGITPPVYVPPTITTNPARAQWCKMAPYDSFMYDDSGIMVTNLASELDTIQEYCDFWLEKFMKPLIQTKYKQGIYIFMVGQEDYWLESSYINNPAYTLSQFFPLHDYHEFAGLSLAEKEKRMRETIENTYRKLYEWKNENYPKIILMHSFTYSLTSGTDGTMMKALRDIPWVDWFSHNGGGCIPMIGRNQFDIGGYNGMGSHYPVFKQMIETNYFAYTNADGEVETRQSRGWGIGNTETGWASEAPGTPPEFLKLPAQYSDTRYYDYTIKGLDQYYPGHDVFQKYMSEWSALDKGNNYLKYYSKFLSSIDRTTLSQAYPIYWHGLYPTIWIDGDLAAGERYFTDFDIDKRIEKTTKSGQIWVDNFVLIEDGTNICQEGDFETIPSSAWARRESFVSHTNGVGVNGSRGLMSSNGCLIASQICGNQPGNTRLDFSIMAKGFPTLAGNDPVLGIYWESYDSAGNILEKGKALSDSTPDGKFWYIPLTNAYQNFSGYILKNNSSAEYVKVFIYNSFPIDKTPWTGGQKLMAAAYCFNGPYGYDDTMATFTFTNKVTTSNMTVSTSKYKFIRDEMHTPGGKLYDIWGGLQWPLVINKDNIAYNPDNGEITITLRNVCAENSLSAPIQIFKRDKNAGPAWNTNLYVKATPANIDSSLVSADRIAYIASNYIVVPALSDTNENPLTSSDNILVRVVHPTNTVANGQRIYVYIQDTASVKGWTAFNDLPECSGALQEGTNGQIKITINSADEDGVKSTELEYSINNEGAWYPLDSSSANYLESYYDLGGAPYLIKFRARAIDVHDLSSNWIYLEYYCYHLTDIYVDPNSSSTNYEAGTLDAPFRSIQDAIDIAEPGVVKVFRLNKGIYNENLVLRDGNELIGTSADIVKITGLVSLNSMSNALLKNIMFTGTSGVKLDSAKNVRIKNCIFDVQNIGIEMTGNSLATNENITIGKAQQAISVKDSSKLDITHSIITAYNGITCTNSATCVSTYNNVFCSNQNYSGTSAGTGCVSTNPLYVSNGNYALKERSPCWTAGYLQLSIGWQRINLIKNSSLESGVTTGWGTVYGAETIGIYASSMDGTKSLQVTTPGIHSCEGVYSTYYYAVEKGKTYTASAYVKRAGNVRICIYGSKNGWTYADKTVTLNNSVWQKISVTREVTDDEFLYLYVITWDTPQAVTFYVDRIELMETPDYRMVYNGSYELGVTTGWGAARGGETLGTYLLSMDEDRSAQVTTPGTNSFEGIYSTVKYFVETGKTYTASAYVKGTGTVRICLYGAGGWTYGNKTVTLNNSYWQKISVTRVIPNNEYVDIHILRWDTPQSGTFYVDRVELVKTPDYRMVYNGSYETGVTTGWGPARSDLPPPRETLGISLDSMDGERSLQVTTLGSNSFEGVNSTVQYFVETGKTYTASAYVKGTGNVRICLYGSKGGWTYATTTTTLNDSWQKISVSRLISDNEYVNIHILQWGMPVAATFYVDKVELNDVSSEVGYWKLDEGAGTTAYDSSWRGNTGTLQGNPQWVDGQINSALSFNGSNYIDCGSNNSFKVSAITMEAWVYSPTANFTGYNEVAGAEGAYGFPIWYNKIWIHINTVNEGWHYCECSTALTWDGWHHVAFTYDGVNTMKCYQDGVLVLTDTTSSSGPLQWSAPKLYIGQVNTGSKLFKGMIDEVRIYNRQLSAEEIMNHVQGY
ncbi:MAG: carbohydrate binding domain-containing protein [Verrucomicrobia bacterium]|nr:carbohydrate binding domain-containing protein [Verrucomicrobiota bacterium]MBU1735086.1 carbohydrate binding domain-containing protein [Verrucomicrobiota bacterium]MBU1856398.1 carbohydrate binding domain-containing protein [Verrucomicrobiota bacterium]